MLLDDFSMDGFNEGMFWDIVHLVNYFVTI